MKKLYTPLVFFLFFCLSSCVDIEERYDFKTDGTCNVIYGFDMGKAMGVLMNLMTDSVRSTPQFNIDKDTTLNFYSALPDSATKKMTAAEVNMAQSSDLNIKMNLNKNLMKVSLNHVAKTPADLQYYLQHISTIPINSPVEFVNKDKKDNKNTPVTMQRFMVGQDYYSYEITDHKFYREIDKDKFNAFLKRAGARFAMAKAMLIDMPYKVVLNFAKPIKKINNAKAILSADRRQVTLVTSMDEVMKNPALMNLKIDF